MPIMARAQMCAVQLLGLISPFMALVLLNPGHFSLDVHVFRSVGEFNFENPPPWLSIPILTGPSDVIRLHNKSLTETKKQ